MQRPLLEVGSSERDSVGGDGGKGEGSGESWPLKSYSSSMLSSHGFFFLSKMC